MKYLLFLICLALPAYLIRFSLFGIPTTALEILIYLVFIIGLINIKRAHPPKTKLWWPIGLFLVATLISVYISPDKRMALGEFKAFFVDPILVFWLVVSYLKSDDIKWLVGGLAGSSLIVSGHAIYQKIIGQVTADGRVVGIFGYSPNYLALFLAPITMMMIACGLSLKIKNKLLVICYWLLVLINIIALYLSGSRGGLLALGGGLIFYAILRYWPLVKPARQCQALAGGSRLWLKIGIGIIIIVSIIVAAWVFRPNFTLSGDSGSRVVSSNNVRFQIWQTSWQIITQHPVWGVGLGNFQNAFNNLTKNWVNFPEFISPWALTPHNLFLMFWLTTGLAGLIALIWLLINFYREGLKSKNPWSIIFLTVMAVIIFQGLVDTPYFKNDLAVIFWLAVGSMVVSNKEKQ